MSEQEQRDVYHIEAAVEAVFGKAPGRRSAAQRAHARRWFSGEYQQAAYDRAYRAREDRRAAWVREQPEPRARDVLLAAVAMLWPFALMLISWLLCA
jgi:hypothetical protein